MFLFLQYDAYSSLDKASSAPFERGELSRGLAPSSTGQCYLRLMTEGRQSLLDLLAERSIGTAWQSLPELWDAYAVERAGGRSPFSAAVQVAGRADRLGHAFAVGYPAALEHLSPGVLLPCALCATEAQGNSPRAIETTLTEVGESYRLDGEKTFVTFGTLAKTLIIVARSGLKPDGRPDIVVVQVPADRAGVHVEELPPGPFVPEVAHAWLRLEGVQVHPGERLPGDGYLQYVKPFRTIEDIHVLGSTLAYLVGWARRVGAPSTWIAELSADLVALDALRAEEPLDARAHIALHGCYRRLIQTAQGEELRRLLESASDAERERWLRDAALLKVASKARERRFEAATRAIGLDRG